MTRRVLVMFVILLVVAAGLGWYAYHLKRRVALEEQRLAQQPNGVLSPASGPTTLVTFYLASEADGGLRRVQENVPLPEERSERARTVLRTLLAKYGTHSQSQSGGADSDVRDVFLLGTDTAVVDTSASFADSHPSGVLAEELTVASIVATLNASFPQIVRVKILVDGKERDTLAGHADLKRFYTAGEVDNFAKEAR
jgi:hypothetical protein